MPQDLSMYYGYDEAGKYRYNYKPSVTGGIATPKMKLVGDLKAIGLKDKEVHAAVKKPGSKSFGQAINPFKKDRLIMERMNNEIEKMVGQAKDIIKRASLRAAQNYEAAVEEGDLKASGKVLDLCGAFSKVTDVNVNIGFGQWLKGVQDRDDVISAIEDIKPTEIDITPSSLPDPLERVDPSRVDRDVPSGCSRIVMQDI